MKNLGAAICMIPSRNNTPKAKCTYTLVMRRGDRKDQKAGENFS